MDWISRAYILALNQHNLDHLFGSRAHNARFGPGLYERVLLIWIWNVMPSHYIGIFWVGLVSGMYL